MGTICPTTYANLFIEEFEKQPVKYVRTLQANPYFIYDILIINSRYGQKLKKN